MIPDRYSKDRARFLNSCLWKEKRWRKEGDVMKSMIITRKKNKDQCTTSLKHKWSLKYMRNISSHTHTYEQTHTLTHTHINTHIYTHIHTNVNARTHEHTNTHTHIYKETHTKWNTYLIVSWFLIILAYSGVSQHVSVSCIVISRILSNKSIFRARDNWCSSLARIWSKIRNMYH